MNVFPIHTETTAPHLDRRSKALRRKIVLMMKAAGRGHLASALSLVEILRVLYDDILIYDPADPKWRFRDRCILSKGHGCLSLYVLLAEKGFFPEELLWDFCKQKGLLGGHPEHKIPGVEASTGSLGHGLSIGIGFSLNAHYEKTGYRTFVIIGDGECNEGSVWEAAMCAAKHKLNNLTVLVDYNKYQSYGPTGQVQELEPFAEKWRGFGFSTKEIDGHNIQKLRKVLSELPINKGKPNVIICHTIKGRGIPFIENNPEWHHKSNLSDKDVNALLSALEGDS